MKRYLLNLLIAIDQLVNAVLGGYPDETISSRMGKAIRDGRCLGCRFLCNLLSVMLNQNNHCIQSIEEDEGRPRDYAVSDNNNKNEKG